MPCWKYIVIFVKNMSQFKKTEDRGYLGLDNNS